MPPIAYALREEYAGTVTIQRDGTDVEQPRFLGGLIAVADDRDFDVAEALDAGDGIIVADATDAALLLALDEYLPLKRVPVPANVADGYVSKYGGTAATLRDELERRNLDTSGVKADLIARLEANDAAVAAGDQAAASSPNPETAGDAGQES